MTEEPRIDGDQPEQHEKPRINGDQPAHGENEVETVGGENGVETVDGENGVETVDGENEVETVDGVPVLAEVRSIERASPASLPAIQAVAAAATGFVAGAATLALVKRRSARKLAQARSGPRRAVDMLPIVATRTLLVDVHLIGRPGD